MITSRLVGGVLAAISFVILGLAMSSLGSGGTGIQVMDRMGQPFVIAFLAAQAVVLFLFVNPAERLVPVFLLIGGTAAYVLVFIGTQGDSSPLQYALYAGSSFSGLATGMLTMLGGK